LAEEITKEDKFSKTEGNLYFYAPELCTGKKKGFSAKAVDVWAFGVIIFILIYKELPFLPDNPTNLVLLFQMISEAE
jgi:serine/threonine protein kinase